MKSGSRIVWEVCGSPCVEECEPTPGARCWVCAGPADRSAERESWMGASFVGQNKVRLPESDSVCEPCLFVMSRTSPVPDRPPAPGKKFGGNFRNYSHLWEAGGFYANASKGEKPAIREFLRRDHKTDWFAAIADSGQKHVLPWVPLNPPGRSGLVLFDETIVRVVPAMMTMADRMADLLTTGATKDEVQSGAYTTYSWMRCPDDVRRFEESWGHQRGGAAFGLALWLAQRDEEAVATRQAAEREEAKRKKEAAKAKERKSDSTKKRKGKHGQGHEVENRRAHGGAADGDPQRVPVDAGVQRAEALGSDAEPDARGGEDVRKRRGVGHGDCAKPPVAGPAQLLLFGAVEPRSRRR